MFWVASHRQYPINLVQHIFQSADTGAVNLLSVNPGSCLGEAGEVAGTNIGLDFQGGVYCVTGHGVMMPLMPLLTGDWSGYDLQREAGEYSSQKSVFVPYTKI